MPKNVVTVLVLLLPSFALAATPDYHRVIRPILRERCVGCHNPNRKAGELDLSSYASILAGSSSGKVVERGLPEDSLLYLVVTHEEEPAMPPEGDRLEDDKLAALRTWIEFGMPENAAAAKSAVSLRPKDEPVSPRAEMQTPAKDVAPAVPTSAASDRLVFQSERANAVTALAASKDLVARSAQNQIVLFETTGKFVDVLAFPEGDVFDLHFSVDGERLVAAGGTHAASGRVVLWDTTTRERIAEYGDEFDTVLAADSTPGGSTLVFGGAERLVKIVDVKNGTLTHKLDKHTDWVFDVAFNPDGLIFASADRAGNLFVWETTSGRHIHTLRGHRGAITEIAWLNHEDAFVTVGDDGTVRIWDAHQGQQIAFWEASDGGLLGVAVSPDDTIHTIGRNGEWMTWDRKGARLDMHGVTESMPTEIEVTDDLVAIGTWNGKVRLLDEQAVGATLSVPSEKTSTALTSLNVEPRRSIGFRQYDATSSQPPPQDSHGGSSPNVVMSHAVTTAGTSNQLSLAESATAHFRQRELHLAEEAKEFSEMVAELREVLKVISELEARNGISNDEVLRNLVAGLELHREQAANAMFSDIELLIQLAQERAQSKLQNNEPVRRLTGSDALILDNCQRAIRRLNDRVVDRLAMQGSGASLWKKLQQQLAGLSLRALTLSKR